MKQNVPTSKQLKALCMIIRIKISQYSIRYLRKNRYYSTE